ncbi:MAG TPA: hypothetical protein VM557_11860, partial [Thermoanaerobaculia bacterium]|nr:hypothetical protein [Thermoanaerobaculia bacterium]
QFVPVASELKHGSPFYVEAVFDIPPPEDEFPVKLSWGEEESTEIPVRRSSDARTFRSEAITLQPPAVNQ